MQISIALSFALGANATIPVLLLAKDLGTGRTSSESVKRATDASFARDELPDAMISVCPASLLSTLIVESTGLTPSSLGYRGLRGPLG